MKTYRVTDDQLVFSYTTEDVKKVEVCARRGDTLQLPEENSTVKKLLARKQIAEVVSAKAGKTNK